jgi:hypothetical protein
MYSIQFQLKMKREITNEFCCLSFTIVQGHLKFKQSLIRIVHDELIQVEGILSVYWKLS